MAWLISVECFHGSLNRIHVEFEKESSLELQEGLCNHGVRQFQCWPLSFDKFLEYVLLLEAVPMAGASKFSLHKLRLTIIRSLRLVYALDRVNWLNLLYAPCGGGGGGDIEDWLAIDFLGIYAPWQLSFFYYYSFYLSWILIRCLIAIMVHLARVGVVFGLPTYCQSLDHSR
jgi:hypothetical protein